MELEITEINRQVQEKSAFLQTIKQEVSKIIVGQEEIIDRLLIGLLSNAHVLLEGVPGLAKTLMVKTLAQTVDATFKRIQFTPDLLPADLTGTLIFNPKEGNFAIRKGPLFSNFVLADEINRSPAKVQSALLECMQERQITIGENSFRLPDVFLVLATQNPIEQEGTYPLPEAQIDRFMMKLVVGYSKRTEEKEILERMAGAAPPLPSKVVDTKTIVEARALVQSVYMDDKVKNYILDIVFATREPEAYKLSSLKNWIQYGASPRATIFLAQASRAFAFLNGRGYVTPEDVKSIGFDVLRHRLKVTYEAEAENISSEEIVKRVFETIEVP